MTPIRPYLIRAIHQWIIDNQLSPYLLVNATEKKVSVPQQYVQDGKIILNIAPEAINQLQITNQYLKFDARFNGILEHIYVPMRAVLAIYAKENGRGMTFETEEFVDEEDSPPPTTPPSKGGHLKVVK